MYVYVCIVQCSLLVVPVQAVLRNLHPLRARVCSGALVVNATNYTVGVIKQALAKLSDEVRWKICVYSVCSPSCTIGGAYTRVDV